MRRDEVPLRLADVAARFDIVVSDEPNLAGFAGSLGGGGAAAGVGILGVLHIYEGGLLLLLHRLTEKTDHLRCP